MGVTGLNANQVAAGAARPGIFTDLFNGNQPSQGTTWTITFSEAKEFVWFDIFLDGAVLLDSINFYINGDTTGTNYHRQNTQGFNGATLTSAEASDAFAGFAGVGLTSHLWGSMRRSAAGAIISLHNTAHYLTDQIAHNDIGLVYEASAPASFNAINLVMSSTGEITTDSNADIWGK